jgi:hypothetical protein
MLPGRRSFDNSHVIQQRYLHERTRAGDPSLPRAENRAPPDNTVMKRFVAFVIFAIGCGNSSTHQPDASTVDRAATDASGVGTYMAYALIGGLDRVRITKVAGSTCFEIQLVSPGSNGRGLTLPTNWGLDFARAMQPIGACDPRYTGPVQNMLDTSSQTGTIAWTGTSPPQIVDSVQATLNFTGNAWFVPPNQMFATTNLQVQ